MAEQERRRQVLAHHTSFGTVRDVGVDGVDGLVSEDARESAGERMGLPSVMNHLAIDGVAYDALHHGDED